MRKLLLLVALLATAPALATDVEVSVRTDETPSPG